MVILVQSDKVSTLLFESRFIAHDTRVLKHFLDSTIDLERYNQQTRLVSSPGPSTSGSEDDVKDENDTGREANIQGGIKPASEGIDENTEGFVDEEEDDSEGERVLGGDDIIWEEFARGNFISEKASLRAELSETLPS